MKRAAKVLLCFALPVVIVPGGLMRCSYSDEDIRQIRGGNALRVLARVED